MYETILPLTNSYIRFISMTKNSNEEFYLKNRKVFSPGKNIRTSSYKKCSHGNTYVTLKPKKSDVILCDSCQILSPGDIYTFLSYDLGKDIRLFKINDVNKKCDYEYGYLKICYVGNHKTKINLSFNESCFCRDMKCDDVSKYIEFVPGEYCFSVYDDNGIFLIQTDHLTIENGKCYTLYVTSDNKNKFSTLITTDMDNGNSFLR